MPARHNAPVVDSGDMSTRCAPTFIDVAIANGSPPPSRIDEPGDRRQERRQDDARRAAVDRDHRRDERDDAGDRVGVAMPASTAVNRSRPPVFSSSAISTVTPLTITIGVQGIRWIACS